MSSFLQGLSADEAAALVRLRIIKDLPKSRYATRPAVMALDKRGKKVIYSHIEVYKMVEEAAHVLRENGVRPKTVVAMLFNNSVEAVVTFLALEWVHAKAAPISPEMTVEGITGAIRNVGASVIITQFVDEADRTEGDVCTKAKQTSVESGLKLWYTMRTLNRGVFLETNKDVIGDPAWHGGAGDYTLDMDEDAILTHALDMERLVLPLTHRNICTSTKIFTKCYDISADSVTLWAKPIYDVHGILVLLVSFYSGGLLVIPPGGHFEPEQFWDLVLLTGVTWVSTDANAVTLIKEVTETPMKSTTLKFIRASGGGFIDPREHGDYEAIFGVPILESYGLAECSGLATSNTTLKSKPGTMGQTCDGIDIAIFSTDPEDREMLPPNEIGDIAVKGPSVTQGYINNDEENRFGRILTKFEMSVSESGSTTASELIEEWFATGDRGELDEDGFLILYGSGRDFRAGEELARSAARMEREKAASEYVAAAAAAERKKEEEAAALLKAEADAKAAAEAERAAALKMQEDAARKAKDEEVTRSLLAVQEAEASRKAKVEEEQRKAEAAALASMQSRGFAGEKDIRSDSMMVVATANGTKLTEEDLQSDKYRNEWMTVNKFMGIEHEDSSKRLGQDPTAKKVFIRKVESQDVQLPDGYERKKRSTAHFNNVSFEYFYDDDEDQNTIEHVLHTIPDWDEATHPMEGESDETFQLVAMSDEQMSELRVSAEEAFMQKLAEEEEKLQREGRVRLLEDRERLERLRGEEIAALEKLYQSELEHKVDEAYVERKEHYDLMLEEEKQRQSEAYLANVEAQRKIREEEFALALAYLEIRKEDELQRGLALAEREVNAEILVDWEKEQLAEAEIVEAERAKAMEARSARLRSIEEENLTWKTKMRQYYDDTLTAMLTMYEKRLLTDRESFDTINEQVDALTAKQAAIEVELSTVYEKEQEETELFLADLKTRRVEVEREAYRMRQEIYRAAQTPQLMEVNMETMEGLVFESARAADEAALAAEEAEEMFREAESALKDAELAVEATNAAVGADQVYRAEDIRESASFRPPQAVETVYRSAQLYEPDDDPDEVTQEILVDLDEIDQTMVLHPAVEKCISYTVEDPKSGVDIRSNVVLAPGARCSEEWLELYARSKLPVSQVPSSFRRVAAIPPLISREAASVMPTTAVDFVPSRTRKIKAPVWRHNPKNVKAN